MANKDSNASKTKAKQDIISNMCDSKNCDIVLDNKIIEDEYVGEVEHLGR